MVDLPAYIAKEKSVTTMELTPKQQATELLKDAQNILIMTHERPDTDALGSLLALTLALGKLGKNPTAVATGPVPESHDFLPGRTLLKPSLEGSRDFIISVDTTETKVEKILYKRDGDQKLNIILTPAAGATLAPEQISFNSGSYKWDVIVVLDCSDISRLGPIHEEQADLFYSTPVVNIDHHPGNDYFGKVNLVDLTATSTAEILVSLLESLGRDKPLLDEDIATCLLAGIMGDTSSFQNSNTTPKSFTVAAQLVAAGARQQDIVRRIFKTKSLSTLRLWGKALAKLQAEPELRFVWSAMTAAEIAETGATPEQTSGLIDELLKTTEGVDFALLLSERDGAVHGSLRAVGSGIDVSQIAALFDGGGHPAAAAFDTPNTSLTDAQQNIIFKVRQFQAKRLQGQ